MASIQHRLNKVRSPRVQITYDVEIGDAFKQTELPFNIGIIANLHGETIPTKDYKSRKFINIDQDNVMDVMKSINPSITIPYKLSLSTINETDITNSISINFTHIDNFSPDYLLDTIGPLHDLYTRLQLLRELAIKMQNNHNSYLQVGVALCNNNEDISSLLKKYNIVVSNDVIEMFEELILCKFTECDEDNIVYKTYNYIMKIESILSKCLNDILHIPAFQELEATWRGIMYMIQKVSWSQTLCLKIFDCTKLELIKDLNSALEFDQSYIFQQVYEEQYGTYGGSPFGMIGVDFYVGNDSVSVGLLNKFSEVMAASHCIGIYGISPSLFDLNSFTELYKIRDIAKVFNSKSFTQLRGFRETDDSRYIGLLMSRYMSRLPYSSTDNPIEKIPSFKEIVMTDDINCKNDHNKYVWSNPIYLYATCVAESFFNYGWFGSIIGPENGGLITPLNISLYKNEDNETVIKCPTEIIITDRREKELSDHGIISICFCKDTNKAAFFSSVSANKPIKYNTADATSNALLSSRLQYILNASRFAHYIKVMCRDKIGTYQSAEALEQYLNTWISDYILLNTSNDIEINTAYPLTGANISVVEDTFRPGKYKAIILIQPRLQMEEVNFSLRLVARLGA